MGPGFADWLSRLGLLELTEDPNPALLDSATADRAPTAGLVHHLTVGRAT